MKQRSPSPKPPPTARLIRWVGMGVVILWAHVAMPLATAQPALEVAVAANFTAPAEQIAQAFTARTGIPVHISSGASGVLYAQIKNGAPFEVLLAADSAIPSQLCQEGLAPCASQMTYAIGHLLLWSKNPQTVDPEGHVLSPSLSRLALANPQTAPYGRAAVETLSALGLAEKTKAAWVLGENITQAYQFVATGNAPLGFVAASQVTRNGHLTEGSAWRVPESLHHPLHQDAILLKDTPDARAFLHELRQPDTQALIRSYGYSVPD